MRDATKHMNPKTRAEREALARQMIDQGHQPGKISHVTGCSLVWVEQLIRSKGGKPVQYQVEV